MEDDLMLLITDKLKEIENLKKTAETTQEKLYEKLLRAAQEDLSELYSMSKSDIKCENVFSVDSAEIRESDMGNEEIFNELIKLRKKELISYKDHELFDIERLAEKYGIKEGECIKMTGKRRFYRNNCKNMSDTIKK